MCASSRDLPKVQLCHYSVGNTWKGSESRGLAGGVRCRWALQVRRDRWGRAGWAEALRGGGGAGQAGATWLDETDDDWVLETAEAASSSPNGFFPQHTVVIMQFLNWRREREGKASGLQSRHAFAQRQRKRSSHSSSESDNTLPARLMDLWRGAQRQVK